MAEAKYCFYYHEGWEKCLHFDRVPGLGEELPDCDDLLTMGRCPLDRTKKENY